MHFMYLEKQARFFSPLYDLWVLSFVSKRVTLCFFLLTCMPQKVKQLNVCKSDKTFVNSTVLD